MMYTNFEKIGWAEINKVVRIDILQSHQKGV